MIISPDKAVKCIRCGGRLSATDKGTYVDEELVCYHWTCPKCGCDFESSNEDTHIPREIVEEFLPDLVLT